MKINDKKGKHERKKKYLFDRNHAHDIIQNKFKKFLVIARDEH